MFTRRELATLMAAIEFWRDEIAPFGTAGARPYFDAAGIRQPKLLSAAELARTSGKLRSLLQAG